MTRLLDNISKLRDILEYKQDSKLVYSHKIINSLTEELTRQAVKKARDYSYEIEFTSQDLRELAKDIRDTFKRWEYQTNPERLIKKFRGVEKVDLTEVNANLDKYLHYRSENIVPLTRLLGICEGYGIILYFMELDAGDEFAIKYTERLI